jgi:hypothetical protein
MASSTTLPRFNRDQAVRFIGGEGRIKSYRPSFGTWTYLIEMDMGAEPYIGRIGQETTILLPEADLESI